MTRKLIDGLFNDLSHLLADHRGSVVKSSGDELMCSFQLPLFAITAARDMHRLIEALNRTRTEQIKLRIGFHAGNVIAADATIARMPIHPSKRFATRDMLGLTRGEFAVLRRLSTPEKIQTFLNATPANHEFGGETLLSVREVIKQRRAHCLEGAMLAACALWINGEKPLVLYMHCHTVDWPHVITLFKRGRCWGAISKTNGVPLRYRDPIYRSLRELVMSYFHEYYTKRGNKTLRGYSVPYDLRRMDTELWVTNPHNGWEVNDKLETLPHTKLISARQEKLLAKRDHFERSIAKMLEYPKPEKLST